MDPWERNVIRADDSKQLGSLIACGDLSAVVDFLCDKGVTVNARLLTPDNRRTLPLHVAVNVKPELYHNDMVEYLISEGANCNILDSYNGYAPLHYAVVQRNIVATKILLDVGASVNKETRPPYLTVNDWPEKSYPLNKAVLPQGDADTLQGPASQSDLSVSMSAHGKTESDEGTSTTQIVKLLLSYGADCNLCDGYGLSPLHYAVLLNDTPLASILLDAGADINLPTDEDSLDTPLFLATNLSMLKFLLSRNADPEMLRSEKVTLLNWSLVEERGDITRYLTADMPILLHASNAKGRSPLAVAMGLYHKFMSIENQSVIRLLIDAGCDPVKELFSLQTWNSWKENLMIMGDPQTKQLLRSIEELASNPRPLLDLCTVRIRSLMQRNVITAVDSLPLPTTLKKTLMLSEYVTQV